MEAAIMEIMEIGVTPAHRAELPAGDPHSESPEARISMHCKSAPARSAHAVRKERHSAAAEPAVKTTAAAHAAAHAAHAAACFRRRNGKEQSDTEGDAHT